ncbi:alcohol dehydrogenase [Cryphonectria parasitica EP155]|uniref:Alcohol dehydrogenase n=1 Tax=Cryphonectria parasitica (strain ATCC 38755 / EP155) TaxID=660469 RepID=A0A9P4Y7I3_CRYP1|nr:alcohol dehydrogenase [Cryphonectria parasitica EP155]KAF3768163.1 alcohol dehydrogenase [Cryphonectria parasitica EP155]
MGLYKKLPDSVTDVDVIIAGGGAAGCVVAGRLAESDPKLAILVIESGPNNFGDPMVTVPAFWLSHTNPSDKYTWSYKASASQYLAGRESIIPAGRILGGGSSVNMLLYSRPQQSELDAWNTPGWSAKETLQYLNKWESYHGPPGSEDRHGHDGPIYVGPGNYRGKILEQDFISAVQKLGWPELADNNRLDSINGSMRAQRYVGPDGKRQDTAHGYIHPKLESGEYPNLHILVETDVERVIFDDNKKAIGVAFRPSADFQPDEDQEASLRVVHARQQVILSAGALGTPQILERSGVGNPEVLSRAGIPLIASVPEVGENYLDHHIMLYPYKTSVGPDETMDGLLAGRIDVGQLISKNDPLLSWNGVDVQCKLRPTDADIASLGTDFQAAWDKDFKDSHDKPLMIISIVSCFPGDPSGVPAGQYMGVATFSTHPFSRGRIHVTGPKFSDPYSFDAGFLADKNGIDQKNHFWMYKKQREIIRRMENFAGEVAAGHPEFSSGSKAAIIDTKPSSEIQDIEYTPEDDQAIEKFLKERISTTWHSMGTCKMASFKDDGVVDRNLNVYGVKSLKVADLSITPSNVGCNTCSVAMAIGEKAADIIIQELELAK